MPLRRETERGKVSDCDLKLQLLADYMTSLEHLKAAQREHAEILMAGTGGGVVVWIDGIKALSSAVCAPYAEHCHQHRC